VPQAPLFIWTGGGSEPIYTQVSGGYLLRPVQTLGNRTRLYAGVHGDIHKKEEK